MCSAALLAQRQALREAGRAIVQTAVEDILVAPNNQAALSDQALLGDVVRILPSASQPCEVPQGEWIEIETESTYHGYMSLAALRPLSANQPAYRAGSPRLRVRTRLASLYQNPTVTAHKPFLMLPLGGVLKIVRRVDERWWEVSLPDARRGFVQAGDVEVDPEPILPSAACVIEQARRYEGSPYLWGGRSTLGIDCSGLVSNAFRSCGVITPRDAGPQNRWPDVTAIPLEIEKLMPADLLFFGEPRDGGAAKITHVGIYLGEGRFVHATTHEQPIVHESNLSDSHFMHMWLSARRYAFKAE